MRLPSLRDLLLYDLFLLALLILATRLATVLHEAVGHGLVAASLGAGVREIRVSLLGGGAVDYMFAGEPSRPARLLCAFGGMGVNVLTGLAPVALARRLAPRPAGALFAALFAGASLLGAVAYGALGFYYEAGDPAPWARRGPLWVPCLALAPVASYAAVALYVPLQERLFPSSTVSRRVALAFLTVGAAGAAYAGLFAMTSQRLQAIDASAAAYRRAEEEVRRRKVEEAVALAQTERPEASEDEIRRQVAASPILVRPEEVPTRFPLVPVLAALYGLGGVMALARWKPPASGGPWRVTPRAVAMSAALALIVLGGLAALGERVYP